MSKKTETKCVVIPLDGSKEAFGNIVTALKKMDLPHMLVGKGYTQMRIYYNDPIDLYYLGANVVAEAHGIFKTTLTT